MIQVGTLQCHPGIRELLVHQQLSGNHTWHAENSPFIDFMPQGEADIGHAPSCKNSIDGFVDYAKSSMGLSWDLTFTDDFPSEITEITGISEPWLPDPAWLRRV